MLFDQQMGQAGPKTAPGKRKAAKNGLRHGLFAPCLEREPEACRLQTLRESLHAMTAASEVDDYPLASIVIESIATLHIRLARVQAVETEAQAYGFADLKVQQEAFCVAAAYRAISLPMCLIGILRLWTPLPSARHLRCRVWCGRQSWCLPTPKRLRALSRRLNLAALRACARETLLDEGETLAQGIVRHIVRHFEGDNFVQRSCAICCSTRARYGGVA